MKLFFTIVAAILTSAVILGTAVKIKEHSDAKEQATIESIANLEHLEKLIAENASMARVAPDMKATIIKELTRIADDTKRAYATSKSVVKIKAASVERQAREAAETLR